MSDISTIWTAAMTTIAGSIAKKMATNSAEKAPDMTQEQKARYVMKATGTTVGGALGYYAGKYYTTKNGRDYTIMNKLASTAMGSAVGYVGTHLVANHLMDKKTEEQPDKAEE